MVSKVFAEHTENIPLGLIRTLTFIFLASLFGPGVTFLTTHEPYKISTLFEVTLLSNTRTKP